ncbi:MAG: signal recognition particle-docking protein FtsY [Mycoplasmatales bacterium]
MFKFIKQSIDDAKLHYGIGFTQAASTFSHKLNSVFIDREFFNADFFEEIEETLIELDILPNLAILITSKLEDKIYNKRVKKETFDEALFEVISELIDLEDENELVVEKDVLNVFLIVGINGVGKTTTISKLANKFKNYNLELVAADTFRAGAVEQLNLWATKLNIPITKTHQGHAPSAVIFQGMESAVANKRELLICDTAGRLHNKDELMQELKKIHGVIEKNTDKDINLKNILILDGTAGKNTIEQAKAFNEITKLDGVIITKMDSSSKAGMIINIKYELKVPIYFLTNGEQIDDIITFEPKSYFELLLAD